MPLSDTLWSFSDDTYPDYESFNKKVIDYHKAIRESDESWKPNEVVLDVPTVEIQYMVWLESPDPILDNEVLIEDDEDVFEDDEDDEEMHQVELVATFHADNGKNFTSIELLYKMHHQLANKYLGDHHFFEGIDRLSNDNNKIPLYYISCGS